MGPELVTAVSALGVAVATAAGSVYAARASKATPRQERRDDFSTVTDSMRREIDRLEKRADEHDSDLAEQKARVAGQDHTIRYLAGWVRSLVGFVRASGLEPPPAPQRIPDDVRAILTDLV